MSNIITIAGSDKKKKGQGFSAILTLVKDLVDFQEKVQTCIDAQDIADNKQKIEVFYDKLDEMSEILLEMARDGMKSRKSLETIREDVEEDPQSEVLDEVAEIEVETMPLAANRNVNKLPIMSPTVPRLPR